MYERTNEYLRRKAERMRDHRDMARGRDSRNYRDNRSESYYRDNRDYREEYDRRDYENRGREDNRDRENQGRRDNGYLETMNRVDNHYRQQPMGNYSYRQPMEYEMYGTGGINSRPYYDYQDRDYNYDYETKELEKKYKDDLHKWSEKLKSKDKYKIQKEQVLHEAKNMGVKFDKFTEEEFYATYLMIIKLLLLWQNYF